MKPQPSDRPMPHDLAAERAVLKFTANGPTPVWGPTAAWVSKAVIDVRKRDEAHVRAELARLGISEADAPTRVRIVVRERFDAWPPPLPEVMTVEEFEQRFGAEVPVGRDEAVE